MADNAHIKGTDAAHRASRAGRLGRVRWSRAVPGSVALVAALTIPEFSVGAGDLGGGKRPSKPLEPDANTGQRLAQGLGQGLSKPTAGADKAPLSGVRYGSLLEIRDTTREVAGGVVPTVDVISPVKPAAQPSAAIVPSTRKAPSLGVSERGGEMPPTALDDAATFAASLLDGFVEQGGSQIQVPDKQADAPKLAKPAELDVAVSYAAMALDRFASQPVSLESGAPGIVDAGWEAPLSAPVELPGEVEDAAQLNLPAAVAEFAVEPGLAAPVVVPETEPAPEFVPTTVSANSAPAGQGLAPVTPVAAEPPVALAAPTTAPVSPLSTVSPAASAPTTAPAPAAAPLAARAPLPRPVAAVTAPARGPSADTVRGPHQPLAFDIKSQLVTRVDGKAAGKVDFQQTTTGLSVRLGSIVSVLSDRYDPGEVARITASAASDTYLPLAALQAQGIPISYDPVYDEFNIGENDTRPKAARKVHIDQISAPERGLGTAAVGQVRR